jgi:hypothetical protein
VKEMNIRLNMLAAFGAALTFGADSTAQARAQSSEAIELGDTQTITALVVAVDKQDRTVTLLGSRGEVTNFEVGPQAKNVDQIQVGDYVKVDYFESIALYLGKAGTQPRADVGLITASAPKGGQPAALEIGTIDVSAQVQAIDRNRRRVTLKGHDGRWVTFKVGEHMKALDTLRVGDAVHARFTEAIAVSMDRAMPREQANAMTLLFVQNAQGVSYDSGKKTLTLEGVSPVVNIFDERT